MGIDTAGFEAWYRSEHPRVLATLAVVAGDVEVAKEATAEAFARALERWNRVGVMASPGGGRAPSAPSGASSVAVPEHAVDVWRAVTALPPRVRTAVALRYLAEMTEAEVAEAMGSRRGPSPRPCTTPASASPPCWR